MRVRQTLWTSDGTEGEDLVGNAFVGSQTKTGKNLQLMVLDKR